MSAASRVHNDGTQPNGSATAVSILKFGLSAAGALLLATKIYFVAELLFFVAVLVILFSVGTGVVIFFVLAQECARSSVRKFKEAKQTTVLSLPGHKFRSPGTTIASPEVGSRAGLYVARVNGRGW